MKHRLIKYLPGILVFLLLLTIGLLTYRNYGISWDEPQQRLIGTVNYNYVFKGDKTLLNFGDKEYGAAFELPLIFVEKWFHLEDPKDIYLTRHLVTHLLFLLSVFAGYLLAYKLSRSQLIAVCSMAMLVLSPRIYTHSFYNCKDIPLLAFYIITLAFGYYTFQKNKAIHFFFLGLLCGYTTAIRVIGFLLPGIFALFIIVDILYSLKDKQALKQKILCLLLLIVGWCVTVFAFWPYLWSDPLSHFAAAYKRMSRFAFGEVFFKGVTVDSGHLPMDYFPTWFAISTPVLWLLLGVGGILWIVGDAIKKPVQFLRDNDSRIYIAFLACFFAPVAAVVILHSALYDDWRHLYFIYPAFVFAAVYLLQKASRRGFRIALQLAIAIQAFGVISFLVKTHPLSQVYFNSLVSHKKNYLRSQYEMDYWGLSLRKGLEFLVAKNRTGEIKLATLNGTQIPVQNNILLLPPKDRERITVISTPEEADYFITFYRGDTSGYLPVRIYSINVLNSPVLGIYKKR